MDHIKNARNYRVLEDAQNTIKGSNPLCGDEVVLYLKVGIDQIEDISFQCTSCGISMASASIMTEYVKGQSTTETIKSIWAFIALLNDRSVFPIVADDIRLQPIVETVRHAKSRVGCAVLAWNTLESALRSY
jgi:nitrogen fixation NifU-like protein